MTVAILHPHDPRWAQTLQKLRHDVYHLPAYVELEARRTQTLPAAFVLEEDDKIFFLPYLLRRCDDVGAADRDGEATGLSLATPPDVFDAISPYGYPGILLSPAAVNTPGFAAQALTSLRQTLQQSRVCSIFLRSHPILNPQLEQQFGPGIFLDNGQTISIDLTLSEEEIWAHTRKGHQSTINKGKRLGFVAKTVPLESHMDQFLAIYQETMDRVGANQAYYFDANYFEGLCNLEDHIHLGVVEFEDQVICASLFLECGGIVQAHLGGTLNQFLRQSPFNLLLHHARLWAKERGNQFLHIGGGLGGSMEDSLYHFKAGFSRQRHSFHTARLIIDPSTYGELVHLRAKVLNVRAETLSQSSFFPAYRAAAA